MWAREGMRVEVKGVEEGFLGSWFGARILKAFKGGAECKVQYDEFVDENDESKPLQETVKTSQLRPVPPSLNVTSWLNKDAVEVYHSHCWWGGIIQNYLASDNKYVVYFRESMEELEIDASKIRTRQDWVQTADQRVFVWQIHTPFTGDVENALQTVEEVMPECNTPSNGTQGSSSLSCKSLKTENFWGIKRCKKEHQVVERTPARESQACHSRKSVPTTKIKRLYVRKLMVEPFQQPSPVSVKHLPQEPCWPSPVNSTPHSASNHHVGMASTTDLSFPVPSPSTPEVKAPCTWKLRQLERKAYQGVLAAFHAQSNTLTFAQHFLLTDLRKMLNIGQCDSDELLKQVMDQIGDP